MHLDDYRRYDLTDLAGLLKSGEVAADEVHEAARTAIEQSMATSTPSPTAPGPHLSPTPPTAPSQERPSSSRTSRATRATCPCGSAAA